VCRENVTKDEKKKKKKTDRRTYKKWEWVDRRERHADTSLDSANQQTLVWLFTRRYSLRLLTL